MDFIAKRFRCGECGRVLIYEVDRDAASAGAEGVSLVEAEPGEFVEWRCSRCGKVTEQEALADAEVPA